MLGPKHVCDAKHLTWMFTVNQMAVKYYLMKNVNLWWCLCSFEMSSQFFTLFFRGHINSCWDGAGDVSLVLLCLLMLFDRVCIVQKPPIPALHLTFFNSKMEEISLSRIYSICYCQKCKNKQTKPHYPCKWIVPLSHLSMSSSPRSTLRIPLEVALAFVGECTKYFYS